MARKRADRKEWIINGILLLVLLLVAAVPWSTVEADDDGEGPVPQQPAFNVPGVVIPVLNQATGLQFNEDQFQIAGISQVNWWDSCFGLGGAGWQSGSHEQTAQGCEMVRTPGYRIVVSALGTNYVLHTNRDASRVVLVPPAITAGEAGVPVTGGEGQASGEAGQSDTAAGGQQQSSGGQTAASQVPFNATALAIRVLNNATGLNFNEESLSVISAGKAQWSDSCMGLGGIGWVNGMEPGDANQNLQGGCEAGRTEGYRIVAFALGETYVIHTDTSGDRVALVPPAMTTGAGNLVNNNQIPVTGDLPGAAGGPVGSGAPSQAPGDSLADARPPIPQQPAFNVIGLALPLLNNATGLQFSSEDVQFLGASQINFPDSCFGLSGVGWSGGSSEQAPSDCGAGPTQGYRLTYSAAGSTYIIHTDRDGNKSILVPPGLISGQAPATTEEAGGS